MGASRVITLCTSRRRPGLLILIPALMQRSPEVIHANFLGKCEVHSLVDKNSYRTVEEKIIEQLENAQIECHGSVLRDIDSSKQRVDIELSKNGVKFVDVSIRSVAHRIPLINIILVTTYRDAERRNAVILEVEKTMRDNSEKYTAHLFQLNSEMDGIKLCHQFEDLFVQAKERQSEFQAEYNNYVHEQE